MAEIAGIETGLNVPSLVSDKFGTTLIIVLVVLLAVFFVGILFYMWYSGRMFNRKIVIFENLSGQGWVVTGKDKARVVKVGTGGEEILFLRKRKVYRSAYGKKMGKNEYWFAVGQDGYWYNFVLGDLDAKMGMLDIEPIDRDMRYMHVAIRKNTEDRYKRTSFMEKYGTMILLGIYMIGFFIGSWFLLDQLGEISKQLIQALKANQDTVQALERIVGNLDILQSGGSGITPA